MYLKILNLWAQYVQQRPIIPTISPNGSGKVKVTDKSSWLIIEIINKIWLTIVDIVKVNKITIIKL